MRRLYKATQQYACFAALLCINVLFLPAVQPGDEPNHAPHKPGRSAPITQHAISFENLPTTKEREALSRHIAGDDLGDGPPSATFTLAKPADIETQDVSLVCCNDPQTFVHALTLSIEGPRPAMFERIPQLYHNIRGIELHLTQTRGASNITASLLELSRFNCLRHLTWEVRGTNVTVSSIPQYIKLALKTRFPKGPPTLAYLASACFLAMHPTLQSLDLRGSDICAPLSGKGAVLTKSGLAQLWHLRHLSLGFIHFTQKDINTIATLKNLETLKVCLLFMGNGTKTKRLKKLTKLKELEIDGPGENAALISFVPKLPCLEKLTFIAPRCDIYPTIAKCKTLRHLALHDCKITTRKIQELLTHSMLPRSLGSINFGDDPSGRAFFAEFKNTIPESDREAVTAAFKSHFLPDFEVIF